MMKLLKNISVYFSLVLACVVQVLHNTSRTNDYHMIYYYFLKYGSSVGITIRCYGV